MRASDQLAIAVCAKTSTAKTVLRRFALARQRANRELLLCAKLAGVCLSVARPPLRKNRRAGDRSMTAGFIDLRYIFGMDRIRAARVFGAPETAGES